MLLAFCMARFVAPVLAAVAWLCSAQRAGLERLRRPGVDAAVLLGLLAYLFSS